MNIKKFLTSGLLSASMVIMPMVMMAQATTDKAPVQVAFLGLRHHKVRNAVIGGLVARHIWKKHKLHRGY